MHTGKIRYGSTKICGRERKVAGKYLTVDGDSYHEISGYDRMQPFLFTLAGEGDHWFFASSRGGLTCGRRSPDHALFPYCTDDKIHDAATTTGPYTVILVVEEDCRCYWRPFSEVEPEVYEIERHLRKSSTGNRVVFEEENKTLELYFSYSWELSNRFGFVRTAALTNRGKKRRLEVLDGLRNILPAGTNRLGQERSSTLVDAYKQAELEQSIGLGVYSLGSVVTDRAEPSEALRATTVFQTGFPVAEILLSEGQVASFGRGAEPQTERYIRGQRGAYFLHGIIDFEAGDDIEWLIAADVERDASDVTALRSFLLTEEHPLKKVKADIRGGEEKLKELVGRADGFQLGNDAQVTDRHYSNTLFNIMRGGVFTSGYEIDTGNFSRFLREWNRDVAAAHDSFLDSLPSGMKLEDLKKKIAAEGDGDLLRLGLEYLPLTFSRRHGDPSRPWNTFEIDVRTSENRPKISYQGNWRDIFQNWEALSLSYPRFVEGIIAKFLNATTADGYNPYRISQNGIDWEILNPEDPWSNIGYWGDHQIIYLSRLMELYFRHDPAGLRNLLDRELFTFADIPYRIRGFREILADPHNTIEYEEEKEEEIRKRVGRIGADGKLLQDGSRPMKANLVEKLLITLLTKLSNLVPEGGIWMNTQRPEWNDANNALAGWGLSVVTVAYLHRFILFLEDLIPCGEAVYQVGEGPAEFLREISEHLSAYNPSGTPSGNLSRTEKKGFCRMAFLENVGRAGEKYRERVYKGAFAASKRALSGKELRHFLELARIVTAATLRANRRPDHLYHSYNIMVPGNDFILVEHLDEMLEGQVAVMSSGLLSGEEQIELLGALEQSRLYRPDQRSYMLYPDRKLHSFLEKNCIPAEKVRESEIIDREAREGGGRILQQDLEGRYHFNGDLRNARLLSERLESINSREGRIFSPEQKEAILHLYEETFQHRRFTGRSGSFFKYEGLGSIYWHMVAKLQLAVLENLRALPGCADSREAELRKAELREKLVEHYRKIREGIGVHKTPEEYGAFTTDPYSHTPAFTGVQQPGMTGQVKEDILSRFLELGVLVEEGCLKFRPPLIGSEEFLEEARDFAYIDVKGKARSTEVRAGSMAFTICSVPVLFHRGEAAKGRLIADGKGFDFVPAEGLSKDLSRKLFDRSGRIDLIEVWIETL